MIKQFSPKVLLTSMLGCAALLLAPSLEAAAITWGTPTTPTGDTDVITTGTFVSAFQMGVNSANTVNGVTFAATQSASITTGNSVTFGAGAGALTINPIADNANGYSQNPGANPFGSLSASYRTLLGTSYYINNNGNCNFTLSGLTIGNSYVIEFWSNDPQAQGNIRSTTFTAGNAVTLASNPGTNTAGGVGQFVTGTFTADAATEVINAKIATGTNLAYVNAVQLRSVPEPSSYVMLLGSVGLLAVLRRRTVRAA